MAEVIAFPEREVAPEQRPVLVVDLGGQYSQLIARRIRECGVFSELLPHHVPLDELERRRPRGIVLSGGPMLDGHHQGRLTGSGTIVWAARKMLAQGEIIGAQIR